MRETARKIALALVLSLLSAAGAEAADMGADVVIDPDFVLPEPVGPELAPVLDQRCTVSVLNRTAPVGPDGRFVLQNVPSNFGPVRARATCRIRGRTVTGQSEPFVVPSDGTVSPSEIRFDVPVPIPSSIQVGAAASTLPAAGATAQLSVIAEYGDGSTRDVTDDPVTRYVSSNPAIATVGETGVVTAVAGGPVLITVLHEGVSGFTRVVVDVPSVDSDGDGIPDAIESANGLDPADPQDGFADADGDGLSNREELVELATDFRVADTDGDGLSDADEVRTRQTNPRSADTDGDGVRDGLEIQLGTDPRVPAAGDLATALERVDVTPHQFVLTVSTLHGEASVRLGVSGRLRDGSTIDLTPASRGTAFASSDLAVCGFGSEPGHVFAGSNGVCTITITSNGSTVLVRGRVQTFAPRPLGFVAIPGFANNVDVGGGFAYVAAGASGLQVVNVSNPAAPLVVASLDTAGNANDVKLTGTTAYVADGSAGLLVVDVTNPLVPVLRGAVDTPDVAWDVAVRGAFVYVADGASGLQIVDASDPAAPVVAGAVDTAGTAKGVDVVSGANLAVVADGAGGIRVLDVSDPSAPVLRGSVSTGVAGDARDLVVQDGFAFVADYNRSFTSVDVSNPAQPVVRAALSTGVAGRLMDLAVAGHFAFGADIGFLNNVPIVDVGTPASPASRGTLDFSGFRNDEGTGITAAEPYVYLTTAGATENGTTGNSRLYVGQYLPPTDTAGQAPSVVITAPSAGATVIEDDVLPITVSASDDVAVASVDVLLDDVPVHTAITPPYQHSVTVPTGVTSLRVGATAIDFANAVGTADAVTLNVIPDPGTTVTGRIVDQAGAGIGGATVTCLGVSGTSGSDGSFGIAGVPTIRGNVTCSANAPDSRGRTLTGSVAGPAPVRSGTTVVANVVLALRVAFAPQTGYPTTFWPTDVDVADFDGDGRLDAVSSATEPSSTGVGVLRGNGDGSLQTRVIVAVGGAAGNVTAGDVNGDGDADIVASIGDGVGVLLGRGDGSFDAKRQVVIGGSASESAIGDLNGDGTPDLLVANRSGAALAVLIGNGDGTWAAPQSYASLASVADVALGDFDGDGDLDVAASDDSTGNIAVRLGVGDGTLGPQQLYAIGTGQHDVGVGDFDGDGNADLAVVCAGSSELSVLIANGDGTFAAQRRYGSGTDGPWNVAVADVNADGFPDVVDLNYASNFTVRLNEGDGTLLPRQSFLIPGGNLRGLAAGDMNGDGRPDVLVGGYGASRVFVSLQQ